MAKATRSRIRNKYSGAGTEGAMNLPSGAGRTRMESGWRRMMQNKMRKSRGIPKGEVKAGSQTRNRVGSRVERDIPPKPFPKKKNLMEAERDIPPKPFPKKKNLMEKTLELSPPKGYALRTLDVGGFGKR